VGDVLSVSAQTGRQRPIYGWVGLLQFQVNHRDYRGHRENPNLLPRCTRCARWGWPNWNRTRGTANSASTGEGTEKSQCFASVHSVCSVVMTQLGQDAVHGEFDVDRR